MATATKQTVPPAPPVETIKSVTLVLTHKEAVTLAVIVAKVGGSPDQSPREHASAISSALSRVGIAYRASDEYRCAALTQHIYFNDYPKKGDGFPF
jgi:hypothetical protein